MKRHRGRAAAGGGIRQDGNALVNRRGRERERAHANTRCAAQHERVETGVRLKLELRAVAERACECARRGQAVGLAAQAYLIESAVLAGIQLGGNSGVRRAGRSGFNDQVTIETGQRHRRHVGGSCGTAEQQADRERRE